MVGTLNGKTYDISPDFIKVLFFGVQQSFSEYPGKTSLVLYTKGCNFYCWYCNNRKTMNESISVGFNYIAPLLERIVRTSIIDAIVISGGEPTIHRDELLKLLLYLRTNYPILSLKLDTNGSCPEVLKIILDNKLVDSISMDIKHIPDKYYKYGCDDYLLIEESIKLIRMSGLYYEFRMISTPDITEIDKNNITKLIPEIKFKDYRRILE